MAVAEREKTPRELKNAARMPEYEAYLAAHVAKYGDSALYQPCSFDEWLMGYREPRVAFTKRIVGREGKEETYTLQSWRRVGPPNQDEAEKGAKMVITGAIRTLWLHSPGPGTTKTGLAVATASKFALEGRGHSTILRMSRLGALDVKAHAPLVEGVGGYGMVVLDDMHRFRFGNALNADLWHSVSDRLALSKARVIVTANASFEALTKASGRDVEAAFDRLRDGGFYEVDMTGESRRG